MGLGECGSEGGGRLWEWWCWKSVGVRVVGLGECGNEGGGSGGAGRVWE